MSPQWIILDPPLPLDKRTLEFDTVLAPQIPAFASMHDVRFRLPKGGVANIDVDAWREANEPWSEARTRLQAVLSARETFVSKGLCVPGVQFELEDGRRILVGHASAREGVRGDELELHYDGCESADHGWSFDVDLKVVRYRVFDLDAEASFPEPHIDFATSIGTPNAPRPARYARNGLRPEEQAFIDKSLAYLYWYSEHLGLGAEVCNGGRDGGVAEAHQRMLDAEDAMEEAATALIGCNRWFT